MLTHANLYTLWLGQPSDGLCDAVLYGYLWPVPDTEYLPRSTAWSVRSHR